MKFFMEIHSITIYYTHDDYTYILLYIYIILGEDVCDNKIKRITIGTVERVHGRSCAC